jgi:hypothetical protein
MGRVRQERRKFAERQWPLLSNLMTLYFNEDFEHIHGSLTGAMDAALQDGSLEHRRDILKEWRDWNTSEGTVTDIRPSLYDGFSVAIWFDEPIDARNFMNRIYDGLMERVRAETRNHD